MTLVIWLDDDISGIRRGAHTLMDAGHEVYYSDSEDEVIQWLSDGPLPDILIQDLQRPVKSKRSNAKDTLGYMAQWSGMDYMAGWSFYSDVLRPLFPQVPVVICSFGTKQVTTLRQADDFNLVVIDKLAVHEGNTDLLIQGILRARRTIHVRTIAVPQVISIDFDKVNSALIKHLDRHPHDLHEIRWSTFESLVARLLSELGYEVEHTSLTRDGGVDLWALERNDLGEVLYAIDAKKYAPNRLVGPGLVRAIYGVADLEGASVGMIVTTSGFGPAALDLANQHRHRIALKDFEGVMKWIHKVSRQ